MFKYIYILFFSKITYFGTFLFVHFCCSSIGRQPYDLHSYYHPFSFQMYKLLIVPEYCTSTGMYNVVLVQYFTSMLEIKTHKPYLLEVLVSHQLHMLIMFVGIPYLINNFSPVFSNYTIRFKLSKCPYKLVDGTDNKPLCCQFVCLDSKLFDLQSVILSWLNQKRGIKL